MPLQILGSTGDKVAEDLKAAIEGAIEGALVEVVAGGGGHFEVTVVSATFEGQTRVKQQQRVYAAIAPLMKGDTAPVHAIDRLRTLLPPNEG